MTLLRSNRQHAMSIFFLPLSILLTILLPIPALFLNIVLFITLRKNRIFYGVCAAVSLAVIAFVWRPSTSTDLYRWHLQGLSFSNLGEDYFFATMKGDTEFLKNIMIYVATLIGNVNLMQASAVFLVYSIAFWIICDYADKIQAKNKTIAIATVFAITSLRFLYVASGLWFYLGAAFFALAFYFDYYKKTKWIHWILYIAAIFIHTSIMLALGILIVAKLYRRRVGVGAITMMALLATMAGPIIAWLSTTLDGLFINSVRQLYLAYFVNGNAMNELHGGWHLIIAVVNIMLCLVIILVNERTGEHESWNFKILLCVFSLAILTGATVFIRFACLVALISLPDVIKFFGTSRHDFRWSIILSAFFIFSLISAYSQLNNIRDAGIIMDAYEKKYCSIYELTSCDGPLLYS